MKQRFVVIVEHMLVQCLEDLFKGLEKFLHLNPVIIIDELDKIGADFRGDPSAAMLEVLDPNQNKTFYDNYLGVSFDLSKVIFIATANNLDTISEPLRDRMEIIQLSGYTSMEKLNICKLHLIKKAIYDSGLEYSENIFTDELLYRCNFKLYARSRGTPT